MKTANPTTTDLIKATSLTLGSFAIAYILTKSTGTLIPLTGFDEGTFEILFLAPGAILAGFLKKPGFLLYALLTTLTLFTARIIFDADPTPKALLITLALSALTLTIAKSISSTMQALKARKSNPTAEESA